MATQTTVLLADDYPLFRKGLRLLLENEQGIRVVGEAEDGQQAVKLVRELSPDVVVMDITMPNLDGIEATRHLVADSPKTKVMALSIHSGKRFVENMLRAGAVGYLLKESAPEELANGIRAVMRGEVCLSASIAGVVVSQYRNVLSGAETSAKPAELTAKEREMLQLLMEGGCTKEIASVLRISTKMVESRQRRVMQKLGVNSVAELTEMARQEGLLEPAGEHAPASGRASLPLMATKLHRPAVAADILPRARLLEQLNEGVQRPFTLISAQVGYGKSTLASRWLDACERPGAWVSLDEDDNDVRVFLRYLVAAIQGAFPTFGQETQALLEAPNLPPGSVLTRHLLNDLDQIDKPFILVLDDYHRIQETIVHDVLTELLEHPPRAMHLALLTRRDPPLPIGSLRAHGHVTEIGVDQLRFTVAETAAFLQKVLKVKVKDTTASVLEEKTEGWVTGLRLAALSVRNRNDLDRLVDSLQGSSRYIADYLIAEVVSKQPAAIAQYLLETSIQDRFCASLCEAVHLSDKAGGEKKGEIGGQEFVEWIEEANLFVIPLDERHEWFRYHHLFQQLLQDRLKRRMSPEDIATLHSRAGDWLADNGFIDEAIQHALAAGGVTGAVQLVEQNRQAMLNQDRWYVFEKWLPMFAESVIQQQPGLLMARAWVFLHHFDVPAIPSLLDAIESFLGDGPVEEALQAEIDFFRGYLAYFQNQGSRSLKYLEAARRGVLETHHEVRGQIEMMHGLANQMQGKKDAAVKALNDALNDHQPPQGVRKTRLLATLVYMHIISGDLGQALVANQQLYDVATKGSYAFAKVWSVYLQGLIHFYRNDLEEAIGHFRQAIEQRYILHTRAAVDCMAGLAFSYQATRQPDQADATMKLLFEYVAALDDLTYSMIAHSCRARLSIMQGEPKSAISGLRGSPPPVENMVFWIEIPVVTRCRALLAEGSDASLHKAERKLRELLQLNEDNHNTLHMIHIMSLLAVSYKKQEHIDEALETLGRAIDLAEPGGLIRPFVELGQPMADLLNRLIEQNVAVDYVGKLLAAFRGEERRPVPDASDSERAQPSSSSTEMWRVELLTQREQEILSLLAQGLSNKEIAAERFISPETVKRHVYNIYQKLDVHSRTSALAKATELGLLPRS